MTAELDVGESAFQVAIDILSNGVQHSLNFNGGQSKENVKLSSHSLQWHNRCLTYSTLLTPQVHSERLAGGASRQHEHMERVEESERLRT